MDQDQDGLGEARSMTAQIVAAYLRGNRVAVQDLPGLILSVGASILKAGQGPTSVTAPTDRQAPAMPIKKSVTRDAVFCLECGVKLKMLRRHLATDHALTPDAYKAKWNLPKEYPLVAPDYAAKRSEMATKLGLGRKKKIKA